MAYAERELLSNVQAALICPSGDGRPCATDCVAPIGRGVWPLVLAAVAAAWAYSASQRTAVAQAAWHLPEWRERAVLRLPESSPSPNDDTAVVRVLLQGACQPRGEDFRMLNAHGEAVPFAVMFLDAARYAILAFRAGEGGTTWYLYYGNPQAGRAAEEVVLDATPGSGPPQGTWVPRPGLLLTTVARPRPEQRTGQPARDDNPTNVEELSTMLAKSPRPHGARYQRRIADGYNPFGPSDYYMSIYRGWIRIPADGEYAFCTASNEASFSFLDGKPLVHWPGRHTAERGMRGEKHATVMLSAGLHYIEYYHEEVLLQQMAFLGWRPPDAPQGQFQAIPEELFPDPREAVVVHYQQKNHPALRFEPRIMASLWPESRHEGQYTLVRFSLPEGVRLPADAVLEWQFGDGLIATGTEVEHVYLATGRYQVVLTARPKARHAGCAAEDQAEPALQAIWPLDVYEIQHVTEEIAEAGPAELAQRVKDYDLATLDAAQLRELAYLLGEAGFWQEAERACEKWLECFAERAPNWAAGMHRLAAECALELGATDVEPIVQNYLASLTADTPLSECCEAYARLVRLVGIEQGQPARAAALMDELAARTQRQGLDERSRTPYARALSAMGDVRLWEGKLDDARRLYREAEATWGRPLPPSVRAARLGAFPDSVSDYVARGELGAALDILDKWEDRFATEKMHGQTFFWRGKIAALRSQHRAAVRWLALAVQLGQGAVFESEARCLLAEAHLRLGEVGKARLEFARLLAAGFTDEFATRARKQLAELPKGDEASVPQ